MTGTSVRACRSRIVGAIAIVTALLTCSCSLEPDDLPSPKAGLGAGYDIELEFASALNLPTGANVMQDGIRVGEVKGIQTSEDAVRVSATIVNGTAIPSTATAVIRQDTVLGDTYVAIGPPESDDQGTTLGPGQRIPLARTTSPPQLEDTLAVLATFVNGGTIQRFEGSVKQLNSVMPNLLDLQKIASTVAVDLDDLSENTTNVDRLLDGLDHTSVAINQRQAKIEAMLAPEGVEYWDRLSRQVIVHIGTLLPSIGSIFAGGTWLVPMLNAVDGALSAGTHQGIDPVSDSEKVATFLRQTIVPFVTNPSVDVESVTTSDGRKLADIENLLRMLGAAR